MTNYVDEMRTEILDASKLDPEIMKLIRRTLPAIVASEIVGAQPMDDAGKAFKEFYDKLEETGCTYLLTSGKTQ
ncbi:hypothetical protein [Xanthomonas phage BUDD]|nr:hypothetical protein [Xanthomonas phage BUDD]